MGDTDGVFTYTVASLLVGAGAVAGSMFDKWLVIAVVAGHASLMLGYIGLRWFR